MYFNSQPHKEADYAVQEGGINMDISTHSLTRRLTDLFLTVRFRIIISTHSLTRRLTGLPELVSQIGYTFQLTASQGG